ncbi:molybdopterin synthase sulfur carrier subunit [Photobacterium galatheae]|uniref:molybdopterin synthase sulfur carrier subunit n=1 Tax=Photobacterium galatheae TaxID=1654360 RepID=UPI00202D054E|nr:molybdopterin synthase sulfur carrier subunit [Photobacterium galatheae]MCM0147459.1 molybdopterin synthase sulfur carrier subunit [Photobacterium galatheae]
MITVLFFAQVRELVGEARLELPCEFSDTESLRQHLSLRGDQWALALDSSKLLTAVNQTICAPETPLSDGDEVAFFPPVTGG